MPLRKRAKCWHYRFYYKGREYTGSTELAATITNLQAASKIEQQARLAAKAGDWRAEAAARIRGVVGMPANRTDPIALNRKSAWFAELTVAADLLSKGFDVYRPLNPESACDLVYADAEKLIRVEVKFVQTGGEQRLRTDLRRNAGKFDVLAIVNELGRIEYTTAEEAIPRFLCVAVGGSR